MKAIQLWVRGNVNLECFDPQRIIAYDWVGTNTDITKEAEQAPSGKKTIQTALQEALLKRSDYTHIVFDHGTGEIADYISFRSEGSFIKVELFHCKAMKGAQYNNSVIDVYEVAQQAIKSTVYGHWHRHTFHGLLIYCACFAGVEIEPDQGCISEKEVSEIGAKKRFSI